MQQLMYKIEPLISDTSTLKNTPKTAENIRNYSNDYKDENKDIVVTLGGIQWVITYLSVSDDGDVIATMYQANSMSTSKWAECGDKSYSYIYNTSYIRACSLNIGGTYTTNSSSSTITVSQSESNEYHMFTMSKYGLTDYIVVPSKVSWQSTVDTDLQDDYIWLPSDTEITKTWGATRALMSSENGSWLRSNCYYTSKFFKRDNYAVDFVTTSGTVDYTTAYGDSCTKDVRPAFHFNLTKALANTISSEGIPLTINIPTLRQKTFINNGSNWYINNASTTQDDSNYSNYANFNPKLDLDLIDITGILQSADTNEYTITFSIKDQSLNKFEDGTFVVSYTWQIVTQLEIPTLKTNIVIYSGSSYTHYITCNNSTTYDDGHMLTDTSNIENYNADLMTFTGGTAESPGTYTITFSLKDLCQWSDGTTEDKSITWYVGLKKPTLKTYKFIYSSDSEGYYIKNGKTSESTSTSNINNYNETYMDIQGDTSASKCGKYVITFVLKNSSYVWEDGNTGAIGLGWFVGLLKPVLVKKTFTYNGSEYNICNNITINGQTASNLCNFDETCMEYSGDLVATDIGSYKIKFSLIDSTLLWSDGSSDSIICAWSIVNNTTYTLSFSGYNSTSKTLICSGKNSTSVSLKNIIDNSNVVLNRSGYNLSKIKIVGSGHFINTSESSGYVTLQDLVDRLDNIKFIFGDDNAVLNCIWESWELPQTTKNNITYNANGGKFSNNSTQIKTKTEITTTTKKQANRNYKQGIATKYSHTDNFTDDGVQNGNFIADDGYGNFLPKESADNNLHALARFRFLTGASNFISDTVTIDGASSINLKLIGKPYASLLDEDCIGGLFELLYVLKGDYKDALNAVDDKTNLSTDNAGNIIDKDKNIIIVPAEDILVEFENSIDTGDTGSEISYESEYKDIADNSVTIVGYWAGKVNCLGYCATVTGTGPVLESITTTEQTTTSKKNTSSSTTPLVSTVGTGVSHTENINDDGTLKSGYAANVTYTDVVTISGAQQLSVEMKYNTPTYTKTTESDSGTTTSEESSAYIYVLKGSHQQTGELINFMNGDGTYNGKTYEQYQSGTDEEKAELEQLENKIMSSIENSLLYVNVMILPEQFTVIGDSVTFIFMSEYGDTSDNNYYGYYATVTGTNYGTKTSQKYSSSPNIDATTGVQNGGYASGVAQTEVITISDAKFLNINLKYQMPSETSEDVSGYLFILKGEQTDLR